MTNGPSNPRWSLAPYCIGIKLRTLRTQKHLTLSRLGAETGLSTALLSKLETDRMIPTLPTLANLCHVYGIGLSFFFGDAKKHTLAITRKAHLLENGKSQKSARRISLHIRDQGAQLLAQLIEYPSGFNEMMSGTGQSTCGFVYVLEGSLQLDSGGMHEVLEAGDCGYLDSDMAMAWSAAGKDGCRALLVTPAGQRKG